jgi:hypothetical protein
VAAAPVAAVPVAPVPAAVAETKKPEADSRKNVSSLAATAASAADLFR